MIRRLLSRIEGKDLSFSLHIAVAMCAFSMLLGVLAVRAHREELMMRTTPPVPATVLTLREFKTSVFIAQIAFVRVVDGEPMACRTEIKLGRGPDSRVGAVFDVVPRADSCGGVVFVGERHPGVLAVAGGAAFLLSIVLGTLSAWSTLRQAGRGSSGTKRPPT